MRYKAYFFEDLTTLRLLNPENGIGGFVGVAVAVLSQVAFYLFGLDLLIVLALLASIGLIYQVSPLGRVGWRTRSDYLIIDGGVLRLATGRGQQTATLADLAPVAHVGSYRPLGFLPRVEYVRLLIDGGPLGPRELFFVHDGEYAARTWRELGVETLPDSRLGALAA